MQDDSLMPSGPKGNKPVIILLVAGSIVMVVAIVLILKQRSEKPDNSKEPPKVEMATPTAGRPLITPTRTPLEATDTAPKEVVKVDSDTAPKNGKGKKRERHVPMGKLDTKALNSFVNARFHQVKACYERRLKTNSFLEGKVDLNINISPSGKVTAITVNKDTVRDREMLSCVKRTIRGWGFPKPEGGRVVIAKTFSFKKKD